ncbi:MAG: YndJ family protein [Gemmatales bacterium]|nr:YndJ family protein [Gemmatales bacterium]MDW8223031.1 YndJ family transporter [Gemmatales bacterium]
MTQREWGEQLLLWATVFVIPFSLSWVRPIPSVLAKYIWRFLHAGHLPAALLLMVSFTLEPGMLACVSAVPWVMILMTLALLGLVHLLHSGKLSIRDLCLDGGAILSLIGGIWLLCDRLAFRPLDFDPDIVLLTAIHFHYAAYALPVCAGLLVQALPKSLIKLSALGILISVPLVAAGITLTHLTQQVWLETLAASLLSLCAGILATGQLCLGMSRSLSGKARIGLAFGAVALLGTVVLSFLYGARPYLALSELDIPFMRKWHGTLGALGFSTITLATWYLVTSDNQRPGVETMQQVS